MNSEKTAEDKLEKVANTSDLAIAIKRLKAKDRLMEREVGDYVHTVLEQLKPVNMLAYTLSEIEESSPLGHNLFRSSFALAAGYFSKETIINKGKDIAKKTLITILQYKNIPAYDSAPQGDDALTPDKNMDSNKKNYIMNQSTEKVKAKPEELPKPTYWPFFLALGLMFMGWGLLSTWLFSVAGLLVFLISLFGWINNMRHE